MQAAAVLVLISLLALGQCSNLTLLNVHVVPHTHDDVGWLKTVDQYYVGSRSNYQRAAVRYILDTSIAALLQDKARKFIYVEVAFFERWWREQNTDMQEKVHDLVKNGQLEFINGGWAMNDEACVYYQSVIDQMTLGHRWLNDTFNIQPTIGWAIDPFGHSSQQASAFVEMGFTAFVLGRVDDDDRSLRKTQRTLEFVWKPSESRPSHQILGAITPEGYYPPGGFCFDDHCDDDPLQDRDDLFDNNMVEKADLFAKEVREWSSWYNGDDMMLTMGGDFHFSNAPMVFDNLDKLIAYFQKHLDKYRLNLFYSTPTQYFASRKRQDPTSWTVKRDDFFPYGTFNGHGYWVGYFTSRPAFKRFERVSNHHLQVCKQVQAIAGVPGDLETLKRAMGVAQHHDAVSGTERQHVVDDYAKRLAIGSAACDDVISSAMNKLTGSSSADVFLRCPLLNISICSTSQELHDFSVILYNSLGQSSNDIVSIPVDSAFWTVSNTHGQSIPTQIFSNFPDQSTTTNSSIFTLSFRAQVPALGYSVYSFKKGENGPENTAWVKPSPSTIASFALENQHLKVEFASDGTISKVVNKFDATVVDLTQTWGQYIGHDGSTGPVPSGAYVFRPQTQQPEPIGATLMDLRVNLGQLVQQTYQKFSDGVSQVVRLYDGSERIDIEWTVGPIDVGDGLGREVITRYSSNIDSADTFFTDSNGREMMRRQRDSRATWPLNNKEPVASNYYPVTTAISVRDDAATITLLTDRSQGGSSLESGQIEVMVHRRLLHDDHLGVSEPLNETGADGRGLVIRGTHSLLVSSARRSSRLQRVHQERIAHPLTLVFGKAIVAAPFSALSQDLPANVQIVTLEELGNNKLLVRLGHMFGANEDRELSRPVTIRLRSIFSRFCIRTAVELNLSANQVKSEMKRVSWDRIGTEHSANLILTDNDDEEVVLSPMEIKTWEIELDHQCDRAPITQ